MMQRSTLSDCTESVLYQLLDLHYFVHHLITKLQAFRASCCSKKKINKEVNHIISCHSPNFNLVLQTIPNKNSKSLRFPENLHLKMLNRVNFILIPQKKRLKKFSIFLVLPGKQLFPTLFSCTFLVSFTRKIKQYSLC